MNHARLSAATLLLACAGCASTETHTGKIPSSSIPCCQPNFSIMFHPEYRDGHDPDVSITEDDGDVTLEVGAVKRVIPRASEYTKLRDLILRSSQWREGAQTPYSPMPWSGPPRDILTIRYRESGLNLQGESVPREWKSRILRISRRIRTRKEG